MNRLFLLVILLFAFPIQVQAEEFEDEKLDKEQEKTIKEKMEEAPTSTSLGGSRGGSLEIEKEEDDAREQYELEKQRQLYENEGEYRRGL